MMEYGFNINAVRVRYWDADGSFEVIQVEFIPIEEVRWLVYDNISIVLV